MKIDIEKIIDTIRDTVATKFTAKVQEINADKNDGFTLPDQITFYDYLSLGNIQDSLFGYVRYNGEEPLQDGGRQYRVSVDVVIVFPDFYNPAETRKAYFRYGRAVNEILLELGRFAGISRIECIKIAEGLSTVEQNPLNVSGCVVNFYYGI